MALRSPLITVMVAAAEKAARALKRDFGEVENLQVSRKGPSDFVTAADIKTERTLMAELQKARPAFGFMNEEGGVTPGTDGEHTWIIDPIDGTLNFMHGIPQFCISIGLQKNDQLIAGLILNPITDELFLAEKGNGAFLNNRRIRVSARTNMADALIGTGMLFHGRGDEGDHKRLLDQLGRVMKVTAGLRRMGSAALDLAYVAAGRFEGYWEMSLNAWDIAAGILMVREAGGFVTDIHNPDNDPLKTGNVLAANTHLHEPLKRLINGP